MAPKPRKDQEHRYDADTIASITECTGLIPAAVTDDEKAEAYEELYPIHRQKPIDK